MELILDALLDSAKMLPFLFAAYLFIEYIERRQGERIEQLLAKGGRFGFVPGALLGCVPQCGFSSMAANFYGSRVITLGTLLAVFLATSDEAIPLMLAVPEQWSRLGVLLVCKILVAVSAGFLVDVLLRRYVPPQLRGGYTGQAKEVDCHETHEEEKGIAAAALQHTLSIFVYVFCFSLVLGFVMEVLVGEARFAALLSSMGLLQPALAALIGLVPNCASSILLTQLYMAGGISFASAVAGLSSSAGVGLMVLYRVNPSRKQNLFITVLLWGCGTAAGMLLQLLPL